MEGVEVITRVFRAETSVSKPSTWAMGRQAFQMIQMDMESDQIDQ